MNGREGLSDGDWPAARGGDGPFSHQRREVAMKGEDGGEGESRER